MGRALTWSLDSIKLRKGREGLLDASPSTGFSAPATRSRVYDCIYCYSVQQNLSLTSDQLLQPGRVGSRMNCERSALSTDFIRCYPAVHEFPFYKHVLISHEYVSYEKSCGSPRPLSTVRLLMLVACMKTLLILALTDIKITATDLYIYFG